MPRPLRVHLPGALYYVTSQAAASAPLFRDALDYHAYLDLLHEGRSGWGCRVFAYALLPNQLHVALELTGETTISTVMHALNSRYTKHVIRRYGPTEHVFHERFKSVLMEKSAALGPLTVFLHRLPELAGSCLPGAPYAWSSLASYQHEGSGGSAGGYDLVTAAEVSEVLRELHEAQPGLTYASYVRQVSPDQLAQWEAAWRCPVVGSHAFVSAVAQQAQASRSSIARSRVAVSESAGSPSVEASEREMLQGSVLEPRRFSARLWLPPRLALGGVVAAVILCALVLARHLQVLQDALHALSQERALALLAGSPRTPGAPAPMASAHLADFAPPSAMTEAVWKLQVRPMSAPGAQGEFSDELRLASGKAVSSMLSAGGFEPSNYSLTIQSTGTVIWETMQTGPGGETACWRGEWDGETMRGVLTRQAPHQPAVNFSFQGKPASVMATREI